jgi:chromosome partitioning protein
MATKPKQKGETRKQASLSLGESTIEAIEREAERLGIAKSKVADRILSNSLNASGENEEGSGEDNSKPTIIATMSHKGGVAKTTTSTCLAVCLAEDGYKVLVIDMDGQGNASQYFRVYDPRSEEACIADVLYQSSQGVPRMSLDEVMRDTDYENIHIVPANFRFSDADARMKAEGVGADTRLRYAIEDMDNKFDYIIIDCGPRLDMTTTNAIVALEAGNKQSHIIIPIRVDGFAIAGVAQTVDMINRTARERRIQPQPWRILKVIVEPRTQAYKYGCEELKRALPNAVYFNTMVYKSTQVPASTLAMEPLVTFDPSCKPALNYRTLAMEIEAMNE